MYQNAKNQEGLNVGAVPFPDMSSDIQSAPLSVTTTVVVNPFSDNQTVVESFAKYLTYTNGKSALCPGRSTCVPPYRQFRMKILI